MTAVPYESEEQLLLVRHLDQLGLLFHHTPLAHPSAGAGAFARGQGARAGVPDILIFTRAPKYPQARGVAIELKRRVGGHVTPEQEQWMRELTKEGWVCKVCRGAREAIRWIEYLGWRA